MDLFQFPDNMSAEFNVWRDWTSKIPESTTEDPVKLIREVTIYLRPATYYQETCSGVPVRST
jgi:hypothetical protein